MRTATKRRPWPTLPAAPDRRDRLGWRPSVLAELTGLAPSTISDLVRCGRIKAVRIGERALWIPRESWEAFVRDNTLTPSVPGEP